MLPCSCFSSERINLLPLKNKQIKKIKNKQIMLPKENKMNLQITYTSPSCPEKKKGCKQLHAHPLLFRALICTQCRGHRALRAWAACLPAYRGLSSAELPTLSAHDPVLLQGSESAPALQQDLVGSNWSMIP